MYYKLKSLIKILTYILIIFLFSVSSFAQNATLNKKTNPINDDTYLHPIDANTP